MWRRGSRGLRLGKLHNKVGRAADRGLLTSCTHRLKKHRPTRVGELGCRIHHCYPEALRGFPHFDGVRRVLPLVGVFTIVRVWVFMESHIYICMM